MNGRTAKAEAREIRRAMGPTGLAAVNGLGAIVHNTIVPTIDAHRELLKTQAKALDEHTADIVELTGVVEQQQSSIDFHRRHLSDHTEDLKTVDERLARLERAPQRTTWLQRLRWLRTGVFE